MNTYNNNTTTYLDGVAVYTKGEYGHKFVVDFDAMEENIRQAKADGYKQGLIDGKIKAEKTESNSELLKQIDRMARQIEESHAALRRRHIELAEADRQIRDLQGTHCNCDCRK